MQILQSYIAGVGATTSVGRLACPSGVAQTIMVCTNVVGAAENWVGVFNLIQGAQGISVTPLRYGRVPIMNFGTGVAFGPGDFVCKNDVNSIYVIDNGTTPCPIGESIGIAVGDVGNPTSHLVDLIPEASVSGAVAQGQILQFTCSGNAPGTGAFVYLNGESCGMTADNGEFTLPYASGTYTLSRMYVNYTVAGNSSDLVQLLVGSTPMLSCIPSSGTQCTPRSPGQHDDHGRAEVLS